MTQFKDKSQKQGADNASVGVIYLPGADGGGYSAVSGRWRTGGRGSAPAPRAYPQPGATVQLALGETFVVPEPIIMKETAKIYDLQEPTSKMSKSATSDKGLIKLLDEPKATVKKIKSAVTDDGSIIAYDREAKPGVSNLLSIYSAMTGESIDSLVKRYEGKMYGHLKVDLADVVVEKLSPCVSVP